MIVANLATYPARSDRLAVAVRRLAAQVDRLNVVLNEYGEVPGDAPRDEGIEYILPKEDTKDVGKFYPEVDRDDLVLLVDDDIRYPDDYVARTVDSFEALSTRRCLAGYHCSTYRRPGIANLRGFVRFHTSPNRIAHFREFIGFVSEVERPMLVDQVATSSAIIRGGDMPPYDYMRSSQKFVDVRLAKWCHEQGIERVRLPAPANWIANAPSEESDDSIKASFTQKHHAHVADEIRTYAFRSPDRGREI